MKNKQLTIILFLILLAIVFSFFIRGQVEDRSQDFFYVYFPNSNLGSDIDCEEVFPVKRSPFETKNLEEQVVKQLLLGPNIEEVEEGYFSSINEDASVKSLKILEGTAFVDFNNELDRNVAGSCRVESIRSQIINTLVQFPDVSGVVISIDGEVEGILQP